MPTLKLPRPPTTRPPFIGPNSRWRIFCAAGQERMAQFGRCRRQCAAADTTNRSMIVLPGCVGEAFYQVSAKYPRRRFLR